MIRLTWDGNDSPPPSISETFRQRLTDFILEKVDGLISEIDLEKGCFDITDADNPEQLSIIPKNFSHELTKKILRHFAQ